MSRTLSVVFVATVLLLTSAATAYAECAWMLWNEVTTMRLSTLASNAEWIVISADANKSECARSQAAKLASFPNRVKGVDNMAQENIGPDVTRTFRLLCLPDTVDPRGPKGK